MTKMTADLLARQLQGAQRKIVETKRLIKAAGKPMPAHLAVLDSLRNECKIIQKRIAVRRSMERR
jgi:hypothetical protein